MECRRRSGASPSRKEFASSVVLHIGLRERFEGGPELGGMFDGDCRQLEPERAGRVVDGPRRVGRRGVGEHTDTAGSRQQLLQDLEFFRHRAPR